LEDLDSILEDLLPGNGYTADDAFDAFGDQGL
jgi:hypothetical protein